MFLEPVQEGRKPRDKYKEDRDDAASTLEVSGAGKSVVWTASHGNKMRLKVKNAMLDGDDRHVLYVETWDADDAGNELIGWGVVELANVLRGAGAGSEVPVVVDVCTFNKKGKAKPQGKVSLTLKLDRCVPSWHRVCVCVWVTDITTRNM